MDFLRKIFRSEEQGRTSVAKEPGQPDAAPAATTDAPPSKDSPQTTDVPTTSETTAPATEAPATEWWESSTSPDTSPDENGVPETTHDVAPTSVEPQTDQAEEATANAAPTAPTEPTSEDAPPSNQMEAATADAAPAAPTEPTSEDAPPAASSEPDQAPHKSTAPLSSAETAEAAEAAELSTSKLSPAQPSAMYQQHSVQGLAAAALRDVGRIRENNQDSVFAMVATLPRESSDLPMGLFVVADGMGGHEGGEVASRLAIRTVVHEVLSQLVLPALDDEMVSAVQPMMVDAVREANRVVWEHAQNNNSDMGTTCTAVLLLGHALYIAHIGDTRAYLLGPNGLQTLTDDHSAVGRLIQLGQLDPSEAREHPLRSQLYRTVGQQADVQVDFAYQAIDSGTHILVCSDGLWGMIEDDQIQHTLQANHWPQDACQELIALANLAGGDDNISAVVVTLPMLEGQS